MKLVGLLSIAGLMLAAPLSAAPAFAAKADVDLLQSYIGSWNGAGDMKGVFRGKEGGTVKCDMSLSKGNGDKVNFSGKCALAGTTMTVKGTIVFNDAAKRYEAAMTSNVSFSGIAIGKRQGSGIVFSFKEKDQEVDGMGGLDVNAAISLNPDKIGVNFDVAFDNGDKLSASVPFTK